MDRAGAVPPGWAGGRVRCADGAAGVVLRAGDAAAAGPDRAWFAAGNASRRSGGGLAGLPGIAAGHAHLSVADAAGAGASTDRLVVRAASRRAAGVAAGTAGRLAGGGGAVGVGVDCGVLHLSADPAGWTFRAVGAAPEFSPGERALDDGGGTGVAGDAGILGIAGCGCDVSTAADRHDRVRDGRVAGTAAARLAGVGTSAVRTVDGIADAAGHGRVLGGV